MTDGYTPNDIVNLLKAAACIPMREFQRSRRFHNGTSTEATLRPLSLADVEEAKQSLGQPTQWTAQVTVVVLGTYLKNVVAVTMGGPCSLAMVRVDLAPSFRDGNGLEPNTMGRTGNTPRPWPQTATEGRALQGL